MITTSLPHLLSTATPDQAILMATAGVCLIFFELNRPGRIVSGALGLLMVLCAAGSLLQHPLRVWAVSLAAASAFALLANWWRRFPVWALALAALALVLGLRFLVAPSNPVPVHTPVAIACGGGLGLLGAFLTRVAFRARRLKAVN